MAASAPAHQGQFFQKMEAFKNEGRLSTSLGERSEWKKQAIMDNPSVEGWIQGNEKRLPPPAERCPLLCCFYAEFDDVVGPTVVFQSPPAFMDLSIDTSPEDALVHLEGAIERELKKNHWKDSPNSGDDGNETADKANADPSKGADVQKSTAPEDGSSANTDNPQQNRDGDDESSVFWSIFDATSEFIITGHELAGQMLNLETHNLQLLTRPTMISDERYARNALLFSVGFVFRRTFDPRPFRPILAKVADTLRTMEVESQFLTTDRFRSQVQPLMEHLLVSLNSGECHMVLDEATTLNLKVFRPRPPDVPPVPEYAVPIRLQGDWTLWVVSASVVILIWFWWVLWNMMKFAGCELTMRTRTTKQIEWDLAVDWVLHHIDGIADAKRISAKAEVDLELVLACLRVLKQHNIIAIVDRFFYTNRYERTAKATNLLMGRDGQEHRSAAPTQPQHDARAFAKNKTANADSNSGRDGHDAQRKFLQDALEYAGKAAPNPPGDASEASEIGSSPSTMYQAAVSAASSLEGHPGLAYRREQRKMMAILANFYLSCHRWTSVSEYWMSRLKQNASSGSLSETEHGQPHFGSFQGGSYTTAASATATTTDGLTSTDWRNAFQTLDHRRMVLFGIIHGMIRRVHNFPFAIQDSSKGETNSADPAWSFDQRSSSHGTTNTSNSTEPHLSFGHPSQQQQQQRRHSLSSYPAGARSMRSATATGPSHRAEAALAQKVAAAMNGKCCDDALVSRFQRPLDDLIRLVETHTSHKVLPILCTVSGWGHSQIHRPSGHGESS